MIEKTLTDVELEIMTIVWKIHPCTIHEMLDQFPKERQLAYTTVGTMMRILEQKGFLESRKESRQYIYSPRVSKEKYEQVALKNIVKNVFENRPSSLVKQLVSLEKISEKEKKVIQDILEQMR